MAFVFRLESLGGTVLSELPGARNRTFTAAVGSMATAAVQVRLDHPDAETLLTCDTLLAVYETDVPGTSEPVLHFHGRQVTAEEVAGEGQATVAATYADPMWVLMRRMCGRSQLGYTRGTSLAPVDRGTILTELLMFTNNESPSRVRLGTVLPSSSTYVSGWYFKKVGEAIAELCATLDGPDWRILPIPYDPIEQAIGELTIVPSIGQARPDCVFEYGDGLHNVRSYKRGVSLEGAVSYLYSLPPGFPDNATQTILGANSPTALAAREMFEEAMTSDLNVDELRRQLLEHHIAVRSGPRQTIEFDVVRDLGNRIPRYGVDYTVGDVVPFRASVDVRDEDGGFMRKSKRIDATVRVYGVSMSIDDEGAATPTLTVTPSA